MIANRLAAFMISLALLTTPLAAEQKAGSLEDATVWANAIPTGFKDGRFTALVQIAVPGSSDPRGSWDLTGTVEPKHRKPLEFSGRIKASLKGVPLILEREVTFSPGPYEIRAAARNIATGESVSRNIELDWPYPLASYTSVGEITMIQESRGAFLRDNASRTSGSIAKARAEPLQSNVDSVLRFIVCSGSNTYAGPLKVRQRILGFKAMEFPDKELYLRNQLCTPFQSRIPAGTLKPGFYLYEVQMFDANNKKRASGYRAFSIAKAGS